MSPTSYEIRRATYEDAESMARVVTAAWKFAYADFLPKDFLETWTNQEFFTARIQSSWNPDRHNRVAITPTGEVIGVATERIPAALPGLDAEIGSLYVHPAASRSGIGLALVQTLITRFKSLGCQSLAVHTLTQNTIGSAFYEKHGAQLHTQTTWNGIPSKWYAWPNIDDFH